MSQEFWFKADFISSNANSRLFRSLGWIGVFFPPLQENLFKVKVSPGLELEPTECKSGAQDRCCSFLYSCEQWGHGSYASHHFPYIPFHVTFLSLDCGTEPIVCVTQEDELLWDFGLTNFRNDLNLENTVWRIQCPLVIPKKEAAVNTGASLLETYQPFLSLSSYIFLLQPSPSLPVKDIRHCLS